MILKFCSELEEKSHKINTRKFPKTQQKEEFTRFGNQQNKKKKNKTKLKWTSVYKMQTIF